ncbi:MAG: PEP-CTERM sorting domain-containing protein [Phycisphaeraceae bacterium]
MIHRQQATMFGRGMKFAWAIAAAVTVAHAAPLAHAGWMEDFSGVTDGTNLEDLAGWTKDSGSAGTVNTGDGYTDEGLRTGVITRYSRALTGSENVSGDGNSFSFVFRVAHGNSTHRDAGYNMTYQFGESGSDNAFVFVIDGGTVGDKASQNVAASPEWQADRDNRVLYSSGGTDADNAAFEEASFNSNYNSIWNYNLWYQVDITDINLAAGAAGNGVSALLTVTELGTGSGGSNVVRLDEALITATGSDAGNPFDQIDYFSFNRTRNSGVASWMDSSNTRLDDFTLVPEPASLTLVGVGGLLLIRRRQRMET